MIDIAQINFAELCVCEKSEISTNRVFDYFLTEVNIDVLFKLNFHLQIIKYRFTNE